MKKAGRPQGKQHECKCGCGEITLKPSHKFLPGHWSSKLKKYQHGTNMMYRYGCRCISCLEAKLQYSRSASTKRRYGKTWDEILKMIEDQNYLCKICLMDLGRYGKILTKKSGSGLVHIDHDHKTGEIRGILCNSCNQGLGKFKDNSNVLERAASYIKQCGKIVTKGTT